MKNIRPDYKLRRAQLLYKMHKKGMSYRDIAIAMDNAISSQRVGQIVKHYREDILPLIDKKKIEFLSQFDKSIDKR